MELIESLNDIPVNAYLLVVIFLQFWQNKNRDHMFRSVISELTKELSMINQAFTEVTTIIKMKDK